MATEAQIQANRQNAAKSTGPRTAVGKDRARMNALIHGLHTSTPDGQVEIERRAMLREQFLAEWRPGSMLEVVLLDQLVETTLKLERVPEARFHAIDSCRRRQEVPDYVSNTQLLAVDLISAAPKLEPIERYEQRLSRQLLRLIRELRQLQQDRARCDAEATTETSIEVMSDAQTETGETNPIPSQVVHRPAIAASVPALESSMPDYATAAARLIGSRFMAAGTETRVPVSLSA